MSNEIAQYLKEHGIQREHTVRATPQQNGAAERGNRVMAEGVTCMLSEAKLPPFFWGEALSTFVYVRNRLPTASLPSNKTPYEVAFGKKPSLQHLRVFGCRAYVMIQKDQRKSLQPHSMACIFLGYSEEIKGWRCYDPVSKKIIVSRDVIFNESECPGLSTKSILTGTPVSITLDQNHQVVLPAEDPDDFDHMPAPPAPALPAPLPVLPPAPFAPVPDPDPEPEPQPDIQPKHEPQPDQPVLPAPPPVPSASPEPGPSQPAARKPRATRSKKKTNMDPPPVPTRTSSRQRNPLGPEL